jgi:hypothetical protein
LKPFLVGENLKRWHVESDDLWLIYTPKNTVDIDDYPAIRDHLLPWKERLERRATKQHWWELQQAQVNYEPSFLKNKVIYPHFNKEPNFSFDTAKYYSNDKSYIIPVSSPALAGFLNSKVAWFQLRGLAPAVRGGFREARVQYVGALRVPAKQVLEQALAKLSSKANAAGGELEKLLRSALHRLSDLDRRVGTTAALRAWPTFTFAELQRELAKRFKISIPVTERDEWERWFNERKARAAALSAEIAAAEAEIDQIVYRLFDLTATEIAAIEDSLALASPGLSLKAAEAISEVEGLSLSDKGRARVTAEGSTSDRRAAVSRAHVA